PRLDARPARGLGPQRRGVRRPGRAAPTPPRDPRAPGARPRRRTTSRAPPLRGRRARSPPAPRRREVAHARRARPPRARPPRVPRRAGRGKGAHHRRRAWQGGPMTTVRQVQVTFDCAQPERVARFWCEVLGYVPPAPPEGYATWDDANAALPPEQRDAWFACSAPTGAGPRPVFHRVPEGHVAQHRPHPAAR